MSNVSMHGGMGDIGYDQWEGKGFNGLRNMWRHAWHGMYP